MTTETDLLQEALDILRNLDSYQSSCTCSQCQVITAFLAKIDAMPAKMSGCPKCGKPEIDAMTPLTVYACESSDFDQRPGTFKQSKTCAAMLAASQRHGGG